MKISNGFHASPEVEKSLIGAEYSGNTSMETFVDATLSSGKEKSLYSAISRSGVIGFQDMKKKAITKNSKGVTIHWDISPEMVFRLAMGISVVQEDINMESKLSPCCPYICSMKMARCTKIKSQILGSNWKSLWNCALSCHHFHCSHKGCNKHCSEDWWKYIFFIFQRWSCLPRSYLEKIILWK